MVRARAREVFVYYEAKSQLIFFKIVCLFVTSLVTLPLPLNQLIKRTVCAQPIYIIT